MAIDHFVSKFLTKPWEVANRKLWFYDFRTKSIEMVPTKELFSEEGLHSIFVGERLNSIVERPLSANIASLIGDHTGSSSGIDNWELFRALVLLFPLQPIRLPSATVPGSLEEILALKDSEINFIAQHLSERYKVVRIRANPSRPMFYPESGYFVLPDFVSQTSPRAVVAIPVTPVFAFAMVPIDGDIQRLKELWTGDLISGLSVGLKASRVVVPPTLLHGAPQDAVRGGIEEERIAASGLFSSVSDLKAAIDMFDRIDPKAANETS
jgi:hypothetical protein